MTAETPQISEKGTDVADTIDDSVSLELSGLTKEFGDIVAVSDVTLSVQPGELLLLLGPSGCGKSTTLRMIAGLEVPTEGTIRIDGADMTATHPGDRDLSMVFQSYALYPHKTVYGNLAFPLHKIDINDDEKDERIHEIARMLEIDDLLEDKPAELSGGQRQRVALGRTIVREPKVFLMDEPLSNLDEKLRIKARTEIRDLQQRFGTTTVYVTHNQEEAMSLADRIVVMNEGRIEQVGTPETVYREPANAFVAGFIGEPSMNFLDATYKNGVTILDDVSLDMTVNDATQQIGVRPENLYLTSDTAQDPDALSDPVPFTVDLIEPQGHSTELTLLRAGKTVTAWVRTLKDDIRKGDTVQVYIDREAVHTFDVEGVRL